jgi:hypothetical protein
LKIPSEEIILVIMQDVINMKESLNTGRRNSRYASNWL